MGVAQVMQAHMRDACLFRHAGENTADSIRIHGLPIGMGEHVVRLRPFQP